MKKYISDLAPSHLAEFSILIILGVTPIFFNYFYPANIDLYKIAVFKIFTLLLLFATVWRFSKYQVWVPKGTLTRLLPLALIFVFLIVSLFFSVDIATSWFGSYDRQEGLSSWLFYGLWMALLVFHIGAASDEERRLIVRRIFAVAAVSSFLVSLYAILQIVGIDFVSWAETPKVTGRAVSSFGQPNYLACWLVLVLPFSAYLFKTAKNNLGRVIWGTSFIVGLGGLLSTGSRAAFLVFIVVSILWTFWSLAKNKILSRAKIGLVLLSGFAITFLFAGVLFIVNPTRLSEVTNLKTGSAGARFQLWQAGSQAIIQKPFLGYGLENQKEAYVKYYKTDWALFARPNTYSDRAHNLILDTLLTGGIIGLAIFLFFLYWVYQNLFKALDIEKNREVAMFLLWSLTAYLVSLLFNFSVTTTNIYFWLIVALSVILSGESMIQQNQEKKIPELISLILVLCSLGLFFYGATFEIKLLTADYYNTKSLEAANSGEYFTALVLHDYVKQAGPDKISENYYDSALSLRFIEKFPTIEGKANIFVVSNYLNSVNKTLPNDNFENNFTKAFSLGTLGDVKESQTMFQELAKLSPELPKIYLAWGDVLMYNHDYSQAQIKFTKTLSLLPDENNPNLSGQQKNNLIFYKENTVARLTKIQSLTK